MTIVPLTAAVIVTGAAASVLAEFASDPGLYGTAPARTVALTPGALAWDGCDCDGSFLQSIQRKNATKQFPIDSSNDVNQGGCADFSKMWTVQALIIRCVPGLREVNGKVYYPTPASLNASSLQQQQDEFALRKGITCYLQSLKDARPPAITIASYRVAGSDFIGPEGNCGGVLISYSFQVV